MDETVSIELSMSEALILFEWLARLNEERHCSVETAESRVRWDLEAQLEKKLPMIFGPNYADQVRQARKRIENPPL